MLATCAQVVVTVVVATAWLVYVRLLAPLNDRLEQVVHLHPPCGPGMFLSTHVVNTNSTRVLYWGRACLTA